MKRAICNMGEAKIGKFIYYKPKSNSAGLRVSSTHGRSGDRESAKLVESVFWGDS